LNFKILAKIEGKEANFFLNFTKGIKGFDLGKKNSKLSHACVPLNFPLLFVAGNGLNFSGLFLENILTNYFKK
jgi:hypothetical protein